MLHYFERIQHLDKSKRRHVALGASMVVSLGMFVMWAATFDTRFAPADVAVASPRETGDISPLASIKKSAEQLFVDMGEKVDALEQQAAAIERENQQPNQMDTDTPQAQNEVRYTDDKEYVPSGQYGVLRRKSEEYNESAKPKTNTDDQEETPVDPSVRPL